MLRQNPHNGAHFRNEVRKEEARRKEAVRREQQRREETARQEQWRNAGLCQHCGGALKGLFGKKCVSCGRPKDY